MKITEVIPFYPDYHPTPAGWRDKFWQFGVEIHTNEGLIGIGAGGGGVAAVEVVKQAFLKFSSDATHLKSNNCGKRCTGKRWHTVEKVSR